MAKLRALKTAEQEQRSTAVKRAGDRRRRFSLRWPARSRGRVWSALFAWFAARAAVRPIDDADVWWIAAAGRDALVRWAAPFSNHYSFTAPATRG